MKQEMGSDPFSKTAQHSPLLNDRIFMVLISNVN